LRPKTAEFDPFLTLKLQKSRKNAFFLIFLVKKFAHIKKMYYLCTVKSKTSQKQRNLQPRKAPPKMHRQFKKIAKRLQR